MTRTPPMSTEPSWELIRSMDPAATGDAHWTTWSRQTHLAQEIGPSTSKTGHTA